MSDWLVGADNQILTRADQKKAAYRWIENERGPIVSTKRESTGVYRVLAGNGSTLELLVMNGPSLAVECGFDVDLPEPPSLMERCTCRTFEADGQVHVVWVRADGTERSHSAVVDPSDVEAWVKRQTGKLAAYGYRYVGHEPELYCPHLDTDAGGNCRAPGCTYNAEIDPPRLRPGQHYDINCPTRSCGECVITDGSMKGMTNGQVQEMMERMAADGCANCGSSHDHGEHPDRCCDETCP